MPTIAMYPGSFDPSPTGISIIKRSSRMFDKIDRRGAGQQRQDPAFYGRGAGAMLRESCKNIPNVEIDSFNG